MNGFGFVGHRLNEVTLSTKIGSIMVCWLGVHTCSFQEATAKLAADTCEKVGKLERD